MTRDPACPGCVKVSTEWLLPWKLHRSQQEVFRGGAAQTSGTDIGPCRCCGEALTIVAAPVCQADRIRGLEGAEPAHDPLILQWGTMECEVPQIGTSPNSRPSKTQWFRSLYGYFINSTACSFLCLFWPRPCAVLNGQVSVHSHYLSFFFLSLHFAKGQSTHFLFGAETPHEWKTPHLYIWDLNLTMEPAVFTATGLHRFFAPNFWLMNGQLSSFGRWNNYHLKIPTTMNYHTALYWKRNIMIYHWVWGLIPKSSGPKPISFAIFIVPAAQNPSKSIDHF